MTPEPTLLESSEVDSGVAETVDASTNDGGGAPGFAKPLDLQANSNGSLGLLLTFIGVILAIGYFRSWWFPGIVAGLLFTLFMHELGHYVAARASGMKVTQFFLGFGPKIWSFNRGETEYGVKGIPAGAYVRIIGMTNLEDVDPAEEHRTYRAQPYWQRMITICAGSAMHFAMAIIALFVMFSSYSYPGFNGPPWTVGFVAEGSTASALGIEIGDRVVSINDNTFANWDEFGEVVGELEEGPIEILIERDGEELRLDGELGVRPDDVMYDGFGLIMQADEPTAGNWEVSYVWPEDQADQFGFETGDFILSAGDVDEPSDAAMASLLRANDGEELTVEVRRNGETVVLNGVVDLNKTTPFRGFFGISAEYEEATSASAGKSIGLAARDFGTIGKTNIVGIFDMINPAGLLGFEGEEVERRASVVREQQRQAIQDQARAAEEVETGESSNCDGPDTNRPLSIVGIGRLISCSESADQVIFLFAVVNIFIGIFNLAPVLPVDGGHAALATYERARELVTGKPHRVDAAKLIPLTWLVVIGLVGLGLWTTTLDIFSW